METPKDASRVKLEELTTEGQPKVVVKFGLGFTINLGNYESCKLESGIELEGTVDNLVALQARAQEECEKIVGQQLEELQQKSPRETLLGRKV